MNLLARKVWRDGIAPQLPTKGLLALKEALEEDDPALLQGFTVHPPDSLEFWRTLPAESACPIAFTGWQDGLGTVGQVVAYFDVICQGVDERLGEAWIVDHFIRWADQADRPEFLRELLAEVDLTLSTRALPEGLSTSA